MDLLRSLFNGLTICVGIALALAAVGAQGGRWSGQLDVLSHFAPVWLAGGVAGLAVGLLLAPSGGRMVILGLAAVTLLASAALMAPEYLRPRSAAARPGSPGEIKLIQFNAWGVGNASARQSAAWLVAQDPDIIILQEGGVVEGHLRRLGGYHVVSGLSAVVIASKIAPSAVRIEDLPGHRLQPPMVSATYDGPHGPFTVIGLHLVWPTQVKLHATQGRLAAALAKQFPRQNLIVSGDFNSTPWSFERRRQDRQFGLERRTRGQATWPANDISRWRLPMPTPVLAIDQVYAGSGWRTVSVERGPRLGSDHYPVIVTLAPSVQP